MKKFIITKNEAGDLLGHQALLQALQGINPGRVVVTITPYKKPRTLYQNSFYHGVVVNCVYDGMVAMGFNPSDLSKEILHEYLKSKFLKHDIANENGEYVTIIKSTASLSTVDFAAYISEIERWSNEFLGITIPAPGDQLLADF